MESITIKDLTIEVKRSARRKTVELAVQRDGHILLHAPEPASLESLESIVREKLLWIYQQLGRKEEELHQLPRKEFVSGEGFYYRGRKYRLKLLDGGMSAWSGGRLTFQNGRFLMPRILAPHGRELFIMWYANRTEEWVARRVRSLQDRVGARPESIEIMDLGFRWGSRTKKGKLLFHWRLILLPPERIDYLILHECVHLHEHNHSPAFYERLRRAAPEFEAHEEWLRRNGDRYGL
ncbi:MAG: M48 family metallopeptidase [Syntrophobacteraceae bacterium]